MAAVAAAMTAAWGSAAQPRAPQPPGADDPAPKQPGPATAGLVDLRPKFKPGQQVRYTMVIDSSHKATSREMPELDQDQKMRQEFGLLMRVVEVGTEATTVELVYESLKMKIDSGEFKAEYDSTRPPAARKKPTRPGPAPATPAGGGQAPAGLSDSLADMDDDQVLATAVKGIVGTVVTMKFDANGNITHVSGTGSLVPGGNLGTLGPGGLVPPGGGVAGGMGAGGGSAAAAWSISSPGQSGFAKVGQTWKNSESLGQTPIGDLSMETEHTLRSASGGRATVSVNGRVQQGSAAGGGAPNTYQVRNGVYRGTYVWDTEQGQLAEMQTDQQVDIDGKPLGVDMSMSSRQAVKIKRAK
jgi:hypothetical protein